jgi:hypothetical protein
VHDPVGDGQRRCMLLKVGQTCSDANQQAVVWEHACCALANHDLMSQRLWLLPHSSLDCYWLLCNNCWQMMQHTTAPYLAAGWQPPGELHHHQTGGEPVCVQQQGDSGVQWWRQSRQMLRSSMCR